MACLSLQLGSKFGSSFSDSVFTFQVAMEHFEVKLGNISILPLEHNTMMCNTEYRSYFENTAILCVHYPCTLT